MAKVIEVDNGSLIKHFCYFIAIFIVILVSASAGINGSEYGWAICVIATILALIYPITFALDENFTNNSDILKKHNESAEKNNTQKILISHPRKYIIIFLTLISPFSFGILWFVALFLVVGKFTLTLPDEKSAILKTPLKL